MVPAETLEKKNCARRNTRKKMAPAEARPKAGRRPAAEGRRRRPLGHAVPRLVDKNPSRAVSELLSGARDRVVPAGWEGRKWESKMRCASQYEGIFGNRRLRHPKSLIYDGVEESLLFKKIKINENENITRKASWHRTYPNPTCAALFCRCFSLRFWNRRLHDPRPLPRPTHASRQLATTPHDSPPI